MKLSIIIINASKLKNNLSKFNNRNKINTINRIKIMVYKILDKLFHKTNPIHKIRKICSNNKFKILNSYNNNNYNNNYPKIIYLSSNNKNNNYNNS